MGELESPVNPTTGETTAEMVAIALEAVPAVGGVLAGIATAIISKRQNRRLNDFLMALARDLGELHNRVNSAFTQSDGFQDLAEDVLSKVAETRQPEKIEASRGISEHDSF